MKQNPNNESLEKKKILIKDELFQQHYTETKIKYILVLRIKRCEVALESLSLH